MLGGSGGGPFRVLDESFEIRSDGTTDLPNGVLTSVSPNLEAGLFDVGGGRASVVVPVLALPPFVLSGGTGWSAVGPSWHELPPNTVLLKEALRSRSEVANAFKDPRRCSLAV